MIIWIEMLMYIFLKCMDIFKNFSKEDLMLKYVDWGFFCWLKFLSCVKGAAGFP